MIYFAYKEEESTMFIRSELKNLAKQKLKQAFLLPFLIALAWYVVSGDLVSVDFNVTNSTTTFSIFNSISFTLPYFNSFNYILLVILVVLASIALGIFVINPLVVGFYRFFLKNTEENGAKAEEILSPFKDNYKKSVEVMFFYKLKIFFYTLLLIIPGIIKALEYTFVPYLINEHPELDRDEIMEISSKMTKGIKWEIFVYQLSFFLWNLLGSFLATFTLGLSQAAINTYIYQTNAYLYLWCKKNRLEPDAHETAAEF